MISYRNPKKVDKAPPMSHYQMLLSYNPGRQLSAESAQEFWEITCCSRMADPHEGLQDGDLTIVVVEDVTKEGAEQPSLKKSVSFQSDSGFKDPDEVGVVRSGHFSQRRKSRLSIRSFGWFPRKYHLKIRFVLSGVISERILSQNLLCAYRSVSTESSGDGNEELDLPPTCGLMVIASLLRFLISC